MEPMTLGSPGAASASPASPSGHGQQPYIPAFLMGEITSMSTPTTETKTPTKNKMVSFCDSPNFATPSRGVMQDLGNTSQLDTLHSRLLPNSTPIRSLGNQERTPSKGPPIVGLFDSLTSGKGTSIGGTSTPQGGNQQFHQSNQQLYLNQTQALQSPLSFQNISQRPDMSFNNPQRTPNLSVGQSDLRNPLNASNNLSTSHQTWEATLHSENDEKEHWITVIGFPSSVTPSVMLHFTQCGTIVVRHLPSRGNWMHLRFSSKLEAKRALSKHCQLITDELMLAVVPCIDTLVMASWRKGQTQEGEIVQENMGNSGSYLTLTSPRRPNGVRPLVQARSSELEVEPVLLPQKSTNVMTKAIDYIFGW